MKTCSTCDKKYKGLGIMGICDVIEPEFQPISVHLGSRNGGSAVSQLCCSCHFGRA